MNSYTIPVTTIDEVCDLIEKIELDARELAHLAAQVREYICDELADQIQVTLTHKGAKLIEE